ncbi:hypothetical protein N6H18_05775 [Reichenbachiella agarivorans]|uniref:Uncharacterized protein n=1 Tax=Reichenbachiella agarivorans TaxID=2979464 RepID=A0ABY6CTZ4_9BACT|nr:hypothetical protein [Reichenbachiella agarivorans]UXP33460.1 hypothetical protein N6H18_05775 [Reichenbachiella agarivorans]
MSKKYKVGFAALVLILTLTSPFRTQAQLVGSAAMDFTRFTYHDKLPKYLLSRKSIVLVSAPMSEKNPHVRSDWEKLSSFVHKYFRQMNIDAVAYFYIDDIFSNVDVNLEFAKQLTEREIKYVILLDQKKVDGHKDSYYYKITVTPYNDKTSFVSEDQNAWKIEGSDLNEILVKMNKEIIREDMEMTNYLIPEYPEFFSSTRIIKGRRIPTYAMDLKVETLVVPRFQKYVMEDSSKVDEAYKKRVAAFNREIDKKNQRLEEIMSTYSPLKYQLIDEISAQAIYNDGHQFALMRIDGTGQMIKESLSYEMANETDYITLKASMGGAQVYPLPKDAVVSKYFVQHVFTKDVYVGLKWDADLTWEESLTNFIFHMKDILKVK